MKLVYVVEMQDVVAFNQYGLDTSAIFKSKRRKGILIAWIACGGIAAVQYSNEQSFQLPVAWGMVGIFWTLFISRLWRRALPKQIQQLYSGDKNKGTLCEHSLELVESGLVECTEIGENKFSFAGIEKIAQTNTHAFIFTGTLTAHVIPRDGVTEGDFDAFMAEVSEKWTPHNESHSSGV